MEHSVEYTLTDGTEYRITWDTEDKSGQMHYLVHEDGVLKLECRHHAIPDWTDDQLRSVAVPTGLFTCVQRHLDAKATRAAAGELNEVQRQIMDIVAAPHMNLDEAQEEYLLSIIERQHDQELLLHLLRDAEVERFAAQLNAEGEVSGVQARALNLPGADSEDFDQPSAWKRNLPALLWATGVVIVSALAVFASEIFGR